LLDCKIDKLNKDESRL